MQGYETRLKKTYELSRFCCSRNSEFISIGISVMQDTLAEVFCLLIKLHNGSYQCRHFPFYRSPLTRFTILINSFSQKHRVPTMS
jgi:hypothetical protein